MNVNDIKNGFKLIKIEYIAELETTLYTYKHLYSGGTVCYLANEDTNCAFAIAFKTLPKDSTGVCHIIEHSLLCGSQKYPLKEPFLNLLKTSLNTFLNAFTASDWTAYPFASQNEKDFDNILSIYLDAVFNPLSMIDKKPFLQEGWHLELLDENDIPSYKGVVYNEMKGAYSNVDSLLFDATSQAFYKDTIYAYDSGGDPDIIPTLTYEAYKEFYKKHYTPENSLTYFYGKMDIEDKLEFLDKEYFSKYKKTGKHLSIPEQKPFINTDFTRKYPISKEEKKKDNYHISLCYAIGEYNNYEEVLATSILFSTLLDKNSSPLKKAILDANLAQDVDSSLESDFIIPTLRISLRKTNPDAKEKFKKIIDNKVKELVENGIDKKQLLATINHYEFKSKEFDNGSMPKGIILLFSVVGSYIYDGKLSDRLETASLYKKYRELLKTDYFEKLLEKYILNSNHYAEVLLEPDQKMQEKAKEAMDAKMKKIKASMTKKEIKELVKQTKQLIAYQNRQDTKKELAVLPELRLWDIPRTINYLDSHKVKINGMRGIYHEIDTNGIAYLNLYFTMDKLAKEDLPYAAILAATLLEVDTKKYEVEDLNTLIKTYLGSFSVSTTQISKNNDRFNCVPYFVVSASALEDNIEYIPEVINEVLFHSKFSKVEIRTILNQAAINMKNGLVTNGMRNSIVEAGSSFSMSSKISKCMNVGPSVYEFIKNLAENYKFDELKAKLTSVARKIFTKENLIYSISGNEAILAKLRVHIHRIKLHNRPLPVFLDVKLDNIKKDAYIIQSGVSYNAIAGVLDEYRPSFDVVSHIAANSYMWPEVRVKGGAYGASFNVNKNNTFYFGSYRDPNVKKTYEAYKNLAKYLKEFKCQRREFESYIIGAMGGFDVPKSVPSTIRTADFNYLSGYTKKDKINHKKGLLHATLQDVHDLGELLEKGLSHISEVTFGNEVKIKEYPFKEVKTIK